MYKWNPGRFSEQLGSAGSQPASLLHFLVWLVGFFYEVDKTVKTATAGAAGVATTSGSGLE